MGMRVCASSQQLQKTAGAATTLEVRDRDESSSSHGKRGAAVVAASSRIPRFLLAGIISMVCLLWVSTGPEYVLLQRINGTSVGAVYASVYCQMYAQNSLTASWFHMDALAMVTGSATNCSTTQQQQATPQGSAEYGGQSEHGASVENAGYGVRWGRNQAWEYTNVSSDSHWQEDEEEMFPEELRLSSLRLTSVVKPVYGAEWRGLLCGSPTAAMVDVQRKGKTEGTVACPAFWRCSDPKRVPPKLSAICWDRKFHDLPFPASLPTEDSKGFRTPRLGETTVHLNSEFRGAALFMHNVYANARGQVFDSKYLFLKGGCGEKMEDVYLRNRSSIARHEIVINLSHSLGDSHYHGMVELFSRFVLLLPLIRALPHVPVLVTERDAEAFAQMLELIASTSGLKHVNVTYIKRYYSNHRKTVAELVYADMMILAHNPDCGCTSGAVWNFIRQQYFNIPYSRETPMQKGEPWYVVLGERTRTRGLVQHKEILSGLVSLVGQERVKVFSDRVKWSKQEQKELFRNAGIFIGSHGAGMSNMIFMPFHSSVIEIRPHNFSNPCYHCTADMLRLPYYRIDSPGGKSSNLTVDLDRLLGLVAAIVQAKGRSVPFYEPPTTQLALALDESND